MKVEINGAEYIPKQTADLSDQWPLHELIYQARKAANTTLDDAAKGIGMTRTHLWSIEKGRTSPRMPMLNKLLRYYGLSYYRILHPPEDKP